MMKNKNRIGSVLLIAVFAIAVVTALVGGMLAIATEQIQLLSNQTSSVQALQVAEAGINDAMASLRSNRAWNAGFTNKTFWIGSYTVDVNNVNLPSVVIRSAGAANGYTARMTARVTVGDISPYVVRMDNLRVNNYE